MSELKNYLEQMKWMAEEMKRPDSFEGYVLREGRPFESQDLTSDEMAYVMEATRGGRFPIKQCFYNSQILLVTRDPENRFTYIEGYCAHAVLPVLHGWLAIGGKVVDLTMRTRVRAPGRRRLSDRVLGSWADGREYFGAAIDRKYVLRRMLEREAAGSLIDDWEAGWPLLRHGTPDGRRSSADRARIGTGEKEPRQCRTRSKKESSGLTGRIE